VIVALGAHDFGVGLHADVLLLRDLPDQVLRHRQLEILAAHQHDDLRRVVGEEDGGLAGGVSAADDEDLLADDVDGLIARGAVEHTAALELIHAFGVKSAPVHAGGQHDDAGGDAVAAVELHAVLVVLDGLQLLNAAGHHDLRAEAAGLLERALAQVIAGDAVGKAEVVLDPRGGAGLTPYSGLLQHQDLQAFGRAVDAGCQSRGAGACDDHVIVCSRGVVRMPSAFGHLAHGDRCSRSARHR
jgi:hypothetical protein